jgi:hypothetical protein
MRSSPALVLLLAGLAFAGGLVVNVSKRYEFTNCASSGSTSQAVTEGEYVLRVTDKDTNMCWGTTCVGDAGEKWPMGTVVKLSFPRAPGGLSDGGAGTDISCRSSDSTGDLILTNVN